MTGLEKLKSWIDSEEYAPNYFDIVGKIRELLQEEKAPNQREAIENGEFIIDVLYVVCGISVGASIMLLICMSVN